MVKDWQSTTIGELLDFKNGLNKEKSFFGFGTPIVNYTDVYHHNGLHSDNIKGKVSLSKDEIRRFEVRKGDVFFTRTSETPDEVGISSVLLDEIQDCVFSGFILRGRPKTDKLLPEYCQYCFSSKKVRDEIIKHCTYTTRALTNGKVLSAIDISIPEIDEQRAIADAFACVEAHIANLTKLIEKKKAIRDGALEDLVSGHTRLEGFDGEWKQKTLFELTSTIITGGTPSTSNQSYWNGTIPWLSSTEIHQRKITKPTAYITTEGLMNSSAKIAPKKSVLIALAGQGKTRGTAAYLMADMALNQSLAALVSAPNTDSLFLLYAMERSYDSLREISSGDGGRGGLNKKLLKQYAVYVPSSIEEQKEISTILACMDDEIAALEAERDKMRQIKAGMMDDLLTGRVRLIG